MREKGRRPIPVEQSILWKPLRDPHYVVASLQPADGGRRKIFVRQQVLARIQAMVRAHGSKAVGLTVGQLYQCPVTGADYLVIESVGEFEPIERENEILSNVAEAVADPTAKHHGRVLGWYRGVPSVEARPSPSTTAVHTAVFDQPWQSTLVVAEGRVSGGAFFLYDPKNARWFHSPFYELPDHAPAPNEPKPTTVWWPQYLTADTVAFDDRFIANAAWIPGRTRTAPEPPPSESRLESATGPESDVAVSPPLIVADAPPAEPPAPDPILPASPLRDALEPRALADIARVDSDRPAVVSAHDGLADVAIPEPSKPIARRNHHRSLAVDKLAIIDDSDQTALRSSGRVVSDTDDTRVDDDPAWYLDLARSEGFFVAARFESLAETTRDEMLWVLNEPYSGMLLAVVTTGDAVVEATLHYNLQTDDAGLARVPFPTHRDMESKTIYVRESCVDSLRARCRRLRATNALLREWKVTPPISFLTSSEWESIPQLSTGIEHGMNEINELNNARIAELPPGMRGQFHIDFGDVRA